MLTVELLTQTATNRSGLVQPSVAVESLLYSNNIGTGLEKEKFTSQIQWFDRLIYIWIYHRLTFELGSNPHFPLGVKFLYYIPMSDLHLLRGLFACPLAFHPCHASEPLKPVGALGSSQSLKVRFIILLFSNISFLLSVEQLLFSVSLPSFLNHK